MKNRIIANLKEDIRRLSEEVRTKYELLTNTLDVAHEQSLQIAPLKATLLDMVAWDPTSPQLGSSMPRREPMVGSGSTEQKNLAQRRSLIPT